GYVAGAHVFEGAHAVVGGVQIFFHRFVVLDRVLARSPFFADGKCTKYFALELGTCDLLHRSLPNRPRHAPGLRPLPLKCSA
ncbi:MAG: hypothetical protein ACKOX0_01455, partial [Bacteroidota bacterium]